MPFQLLEKWRQEDGAFKVCLGSRASTRLTWIAQRQLM